MIDTGGFYPHRSSAPGMRISAGGWIIWNPAVVFPDQAKTGHLSPWKDEPVYDRSPRPPLLP